MKLSRARGQLCGGKDRVEGLSMKKSAFLPLIPEVLPALEGNWYYQEKTGLRSGHEKGEPLYEEIHFQENNTLQ